MTALARPRRWLIGIAAELEQQRAARSARLQAVLQSLYEVVESDEFVVRRSEVVNRTARALGIEPVSPAFMLEVAGAAKRLGWVAVKNGNRALWRRVKRRDVSWTDALAESRLNRDDPRRRREER